MRKYREPILIILRGAEKNKKFSTRDIHDRLKKLKEFRDTSTQTLYRNIEREARRLEKEGLLLIERGEKQKYILKEKYREPESEEINIASIKRVRKDDVPIPSWFRVKDFYKQYFVEREETKEIIDGLNKYPHHLIVGNPASGKTVLLKEIGRVLEEDDYNVFVLELKLDDMEKYEEDILKLKEVSSVVLIDDAHLQWNECNSLLKKIKNEIKIIITTRPFLEASPTVTTPIKMLDTPDTKTEIKAEDVAEGIIKRYLKKEFKFSNKKIEKVSKDLDKFKKDLWHLTWALLAFNKDKNTVEWQDVYEKIKDHLLNVPIGKDEYIEADDVLLVLSAFYQYEIPVKKRFLVKDLELNEKDINTLIKAGWIIERNRLLSLHHSSVAKLYLDTFKFDEHGVLGEEIKRKFGEDWLRELFHLYIQKYSKHSCKIITGLGFHDEYTLIKDLIEREETKDSILVGMNQETP
ncbi:MAG: hypothetical protein DRP73_03730, partial [Candidatus Omnitrophota bacterium]